MQGAYNSVTNGYSHAERIADSNEIVANFQRLRGRHGKSDKVGAQLLLSPQYPCLDRHQQENSESTVHLKE